jgi:hypothetical protein
MNPHSDRIADVSRNRSSSERKRRYRLVKQFGIWISSVVAMVILSAGLCGCQGGGTAKGKADSTSATEETQRSDQQRPPGPAKITDKELEDMMIEQGETRPIDK